MKKTKPARLSQRPHPQPLSQLMGEGGVGLAPARSGRELGEGLLTAKEIAPRLFIQPRTAALWARQGRLPAYRIGRKLGFKWEEVQLALPKA